MNDTWKERVFEVLFSSRKYMKSFGVSVRICHLWKLQICGGCPVERDLWSKDNSLTHLLCWGYSSPKSWNNLSQEEPLMSSVILSAALYCKVKNRKKGSIIRKKAGHQILVLAVNHWYQWEKIRVPILSLLVHQLLRISNCKNGPFETFLWHVT